MIVSNNRGRRHACRATLADRRRALRRSGSLCQCRRAARTFGPRRLRAPPPMEASLEFPRATLSGELTIAAGISMGLPGRENTLENDFTSCTTAFSSSAESSPAKYGIALAGRPSRTVRRRSSSEGGSAAAVDLYLKTPDEKSRGRGDIDGAAGPFPLPSGPWQTAHRCANTRFPTGMSRFKCAPGGQVRSAYSAGSGRSSALGSARATRAQIERPTSRASKVTPKTRRLRAFWRQRRASSTRRR